MKSSKYPWDLKGACIFIFYFFILNLSIKIFFFFFSFCQVVEMEVYQTKG